MKEQSRVNFNMDIEDKYKLKEIAVKKKTTISAIAISLIKKYIEKEYDN